LGATQSETIKQVILPAALPGIVGAILLAASRAIGETMIVVLGAGAAARLSLNPFEAMTTVTVKIVSQLTGDTDFESARGAGGLRAGPDAVRHDAGAERPRPLHRAQIPGAVRMTDAAAAPQNARRVLARRRNRSEARFKAYGLAAVIVGHPGAGALADLDPVERAQLVPPDLHRVPDHAGGRTS
jgi:hypothetical protein